MTIAADHDTTVAPRAAELEDRADMAAGTFEQTYALLQMSAAFRPARALYR